MSDVAKVSDLYPPRWVKAEDLKGKTTVVTIAGATVESFYVPQINDQKTAVVLSFEGKKKRLILNKTQCISLIQITGSEVFSDWIGREIVLAPGKAANGKPTIVIRSVPEEGAEK